MKKCCDCNKFLSMTNPKKTSTPVLLLDSYWPYQVTVLADRIARRTSSIVKQHNLNLSQWRVLAAVAEVPGRTSGEVVRITPMDKGIVSRATKALLVMELIRREASQLDGRISHLHMTAFGQALYSEIMPKVRDVLQRADTHLNAAELKQMTSQLQAMIAAFPENNEK